MLKDGPIWALGAMSGTSLDGVDAAMVLTDGEVISGFGEDHYRPYTDEERAKLRGALGEWTVSQDVNELIETAHAEALIHFNGADLVGFHGQTLAHDPDNGRTFQAGDGSILAEVLERPVVWDFRSADMRLGGQGAPLAPFYHFACAKYIGAMEPCCFLNLGGVGNITWIDPSKEHGEDDGALLAFDTGPANAPLNDLMDQRRDLPFDEGGQLAATGQVDEGVLAQFADDKYFLKVPPKSLDRNDFSDLLDEVVELSDQDAAATLTAIIAASVVRGMEHCPKPPSRIYVCGGGRHNKTLMAMLGAGLDCPVVPVEDAGLNGDMLEAQAFAYLAVRVARGLATSCPLTTGVSAAVSGGNISCPQGIAALKS